MSTKMTASSHRELFLKRQYCDCILKVGGKEIHAHRNILSVASRFFHDLFQNNKDQKTFNIEENEKIFEKMIEFCYVNYMTGEDVNLELLFLASKYKIRGLIRECVDTIMEKMDTSSVFKVLIAIESHKMEEIQIECYEFMLKHYKNISKENWRNFIEKNLKVAEPFIKYAFSRADAKNMVEFQIPCPEQICGWENSTHFKRMLDQKIFTDVELVAKDGRSIHAHKFLLSVYSKAFADMFTNDMQEAQNGRVNFKNIDFEVLHALIQFIYVKELDDWTDMAVPLIKLADRYNMEHLKRVCEYQIGCTINEKTVFNVLKISGNYEHIYRNIKKQCLSFINKSLEKLIGKPEWTNFAQENPDIILEILEEWTSMISGTGSQHVTSSLDQDEQE